MAISIGFIRFQRSSAENEKHFHPKIKINWQVFSRFSDQIRSIWCTYCERIFLSNIKALELVVLKWSLRNVKVEHSLSKKFHPNQSRERRRLLLIHVYNSNSHCVKVVSLVVRQVFFSSSTPSSNQHKYCKVKLFQEKIVSQEKKIRDQKNQT